MNWLGRLIFGTNVTASTPATPPEPQPFARCPKCSGIEHSVQMVVYGWRMEGGVAVHVPIGSRVACQRCPHIYTVGPNGAFDQHLASLPPTPRMVLRNPGADLVPPRPGEEDDGPPRRQRSTVPVPLEDRPDS
mgnify:CR=1 FL=1